MDFLYGYDNPVPGQTALLLKYLLPKSNILSTLVFFFFFKKGMSCDPVRDFHTIAEGF